MSSNTTETVAKTNGASHYFSLLAQNESMNRPQNEDRIGESAYELLLPGRSRDRRDGPDRIRAPLPTTTEVRITDERIGDEPYCYYRLSSPGDPRWIWGPDLLPGNQQIPIYRLQGVRA